MDFIRLMLVLACMAPLFILMAIRGVGIVPWEIYFPAFIGLGMLCTNYSAMCFEMPEAQTIRA